MYEICCAGHITLDKIVTPAATHYMAGGTSFYFSNAIRNMDVRYTLVTALAKSEMHFVDDLRTKGIDVHVMQSAHTVYFENIYTDDPDYRQQRVLQVADPFTVEQLLPVAAAIFHLGPLLADDISVDLIRNLSGKGKVSLDAQGYLRKVQHQEVLAVDWPEKRAALQYVHTLKVNEGELAVLTGQEDIKTGAAILHDWGVQEVLVTLGSKGSVIYHNGTFYPIPAYLPDTPVVDTTGCGDTYMAGYLYQRVKGAAVQDAGLFAAAMAGLKTAAAGPFTGTKEDVLYMLAHGRQITSAFA